MAARMAALPEEEKVTVVSDSTDKASFVVRDEDHTLGNALRYTLMKK